MAAMADGYGGHPPPPVVDKGKAPLDQISEGLHHVEGSSGAPPASKTTTPATHGGATTSSASGGLFPAPNPNPRSDAPVNPTWRTSNRGRFKPMRTGQNSTQVRRLSQPVIDTSAVGHGDLNQPQNVPFPLAARHVAPPYVKVPFVQPPSFHYGHEGHVAFNQGYYPNNVGFNFPNATGYGQHFGYVNGNAVANWAYSELMVSGQQLGFDGLPTWHGPSAQPMGFHNLPGQNVNNAAASNGTGAERTRPGHVAGFTSAIPQNESEPLNNPTVATIVLLPQQNSNTPTENPMKSFAAAVAGTAPLPNLRPNNVFTSAPSPYPELALGQLAGDVAVGGFVRAHALGAGEFGLIPSLDITPSKLVVDGKPFLELTDEDVARAEDLFRHSVIIKFWGIRPPLEVVHADVLNNWGIMGRFIMGLRDQKTLLVRFELESNMVMALSRDALTIKDSAFKVFRWQHIANGAYDAAISPIWVCSAETSREILVSGVHESNWGLHWEIPACGLADGYFGQT